MNYITLSEAQVLLLIKDSKTVATYRKEGIIKTIERDDELWVDKQKLLRHMGIETNFDEPFIDKAEAAKILHLTPQRLLSYTQENLVPAYRLKAARGSAFLYRRSELECVKQALVEEGHNFYRTLRRRNGERCILLVVLGDDVLLGLFLNSNERTVLRSHLLFGRNFEEIAFELDLTPERIRQIYNKALRLVKQKAHARLTEALTNTQSYHQQNTELQMANEYLRGQLELEVVPRLLVELCSTNLPNRAINALARAGVYTVGDLVKWSRVDLKKLRNMGNKSLLAIEAFVTNQGLKLHEFGAAVPEAMKSNLPSILSVDESES